MTAPRELALKAKAWPFEEARKLLERIEKRPSDKGYALFETGYGPSGLPHIGTFGEVVRTAMVRHAFTSLSDMPTRLFTFSDDMDGLRKVPGNIPNRDMVEQHLGKPLTSIPDPFGTHESFGHHNNARLRAFLDEFGFEYEFKSSTECYRSGEFDATLLRLLECYEEVMQIMLPSLREERAQTYSPFLPICPETGQVLQVEIVATDAGAGTVTYRRDDGAELETLVTGGHCKLQWKPDWAMRWYAFDVDYEMFGKDLIDSARLSGRIVGALGGMAPAGLTYELFLDENGEKISKSRGNGLTIEEWLAYAPGETVAYFMFGKPRAAKRLYFDVIPRAVDDYLARLEKFLSEDAAQQLENPAWHIHQGEPPVERAALSFNILLNLASVCNTEDKVVLWGFISRYVPDATPNSDPLLDQLVGHAIRYYSDFVKPNKQYRSPSEMERAALEDLVDELNRLSPNAAVDDVQTQVYEVGKRHPFESLREWFQALYEILLGQQQGPRMGSFIALYGIDETTELIRRALAGEDLSAA